ncbi:hypothetical protein D3C76_1099910 [compost metagenome]
MKLQQVQRHCLEYFSQFAAAGVDEQAHRGDERRQRGDDGPRLLHADRTRAFGIEHQANGVSTRLDGGQRILYAGNPTNLAANG